MPCLHFWKLLKKLQFRQNMFFLTAGFHLQAPFMLSLESRESNDNRSLGELFLYFSDEMSDITWIQAFQMLLQMFRTMLSDNTELSDEKINELANAFMDALPTIIKIQLQAA